MNHFTRKLLLGALAATAVLGCQPMPNRNDKLCTREKREPDLKFIGALSGPGIDAEGRLKPGEYTVSSTYIQIQDDDAAAKKFQEVMAGMSPILSSHDGLLAYQFATSEYCGSARTLAVWRDEAAMFAFVASAAHRKAMTATPQISRGGSVTHWAGNAASVTWENGLGKLSEADGAFP